MNVKAQAKTPAKAPAAPAAAHIPRPPVAVPEHEVEQPAMAAQLEGAARLGHSFSAFSVESAGPPLIQRQELPEEDEEEKELQMKREPAAVQRQEKTGEEEEEEKLQMKPDLSLVGLEGGPVSPEVEAAIQRARGGGQPLEGTVQAQMSASLGHDFSGVRVHADSEADALNQQLSAKAFTTGPDIFFKRGAYDPGSGSGRELIAHELGHVMQQSTERVRGGGSGMTVRPAGDAFEREADRVAEAVTRSINTSVQRQTPDEEELQMQEEEEIQTHISESQPVTGSEDLETRINSARGSGQSLSSDVREPMEKVFGADFSDVRVHTGPESNELNQQIQAKAFTTDPDIFFKRGPYDLGSDSSRESIASEPNHVVQQNSGGVSGSGITDHPAGDAFEKEAVKVDGRSGGANPASKGSEQGVRNGSIRLDRVYEKGEPHTQTIQRIVYIGEKQLTLSGFLLRNRFAECPKEEKIEARYVQQAVNLIHNADVKIQVTNMAEFKTRLEGGKYGAQVGQAVKTHEEEKKVEDVSGWTEEQRRIMAGRAQAVIRHMVMGKIGETGRMIMAEMRQGGRKYNLGKIQRNIELLYDMYANADFISRQVRGSTPLKVALNTALKPIYGLARFNIWTEDVSDDTLEGHLKYGKEVLESTWPQAVGKFSPENRREYISRVFETDQGYRGFPMSLGTLLLTMQAR